MSGFAFSHQFSKRWLTTPTPVKHAIIQELDDIAELLQPETDLDSYQFSVPNLHETIENLLAIERAHQEKIEAKEQQRLEQEKLERERLEAERLEQARIEQERLEAERIEQERLQAEQQAQAELVAEQERLQLERQAQDDEAIAALEEERAIAKKAYLQQQAADSARPDTTPPSQALPTQSQEAQNGAVLATPSAITATATPVDNDALDSNGLDNDIVDHNILDHDTVDHNASVIDPSTDIDAIKQAIIQQLQNHLDTYILESMTLMNKDLTEWLKQEVSKQVNERLSLTPPPH